MGWKTEGARRHGSLFTAGGILCPATGKDDVVGPPRAWLLKQKLLLQPVLIVSHWENGYIESFNGKLRDELLEREIFDTLLQAKVLIERWRREHNTVRPHSSLGYRPPAPEAIQPWPAASATLQRQATAQLQNEETLT